MIVSLHLVYANCKHSTFITLWKIQQLIKIVRNDSFSNYSRRKTKWQWAVLRQIKMHARMLGTE